jgi:proline dehydrogenase
MAVTDRLIARTLPLVPRPIVGRVAGRYIAGESLDECIATVRELNAQGAKATIDALGEAITTLEESRAMVAEYHRVLDAIREQQLRSGISVKPTAVGLELSDEECHDQLVKLVDDAAAQGTFVRLDMEDSSTTDKTLDLYEKLRDEGRDNVGVVLQAMLRRTVHDAERLAARTAHVRVCKGIYREPRSIAFQDPELVRRSYVRTVEVLLDAGCYVGVATHDEQLLWEVASLIDRRGIGPDGYEFQMLLGVEEELRSIVVADGRPMRVYVPYGERWYEYSVRRLQENPRVAGYVTKALVQRVLHRNGR